MSESFVIGHKLICSAKKGHSSSPFRWLLALQVWCTFLLYWWFALPAHISLKNRPGFHTQSPMWSELHSGSVVYFLLLITCTTVVEVGPKGITYNAVYAVPSAFRLRTFIKVSECDVIVECGAKLICWGIYKQKVKFVLQKLHKKYRCHLLHRITDKLMCWVHNAERVSYL